MAKPKTAKPANAPKRSAGRPPKPTTVPLPTVTGIRLPDDLRARLDAAVDARNAELASEGLTTNRNALVVKLLREALDARDAKGAP
jgi:hypothetical protein